ncbi:MAG: hypothetical protein OCD01_08380 [Fibrobacterales bacterium]
MNVTVIDEQSSLYSNALSKNTKPESSASNTFDVIIHEQMVKEDTVEAAKESEEEEIDSRDEESAIKEMFALIKMLYSGVIDYAKLENSDTNAEVADGPERSKLEELKSIIQDVLKTIGTEVEENDVSHVAEMSEEELAETISARFDRLPSDLKNLLLRAFPDLEDFLDKEREAIAERREVLSESKAMGEVENKGEAEKNIRSEGEGTDQQKNGFYKHARVMNT